LAITLKEWRFIMEVTFSVAMDAEQKKLRNTHEVILEVNFDGVSPRLVQKAALQLQVIKYQGQFRAHWDEFIEGKYPREITFGQPLFAARTAAPITVDTATKFINNLSPEIRAQILADLQGGDA